MSLIQFEKFLMEIKNNKVFASEILHLENKYDKTSSGFMCKVIIPFAKKNDFDIEAMDVIRFCSENNLNRLTCDDLESVSGGSVKTQAIKILSWLQVFSFLPSQVQVPVSASPTLESLSSVETSISSSSEQIDLINFITSNPDLPTIDENNPYNEIDAVLLATIVYCPMISVPEYGIHDNSFTIKDFANIMIPYLKGQIHDTPYPTAAQEKHIIDKFKTAMASEVGKYTREKNIIHTLKFMSECKRYKDIKMGDVYCKFEKKLQVKSVEQFAGVTFSIGNDTKVIAIRGTDETLAGWKENIDLAWSNNVQSQQHAFAYLGGISKLYPDAKISLTGHSKGGHLALYSSLRVCDMIPSVKERLLSVYNFDGPGIRQDILDKYRNSYNSIKDRIISFIPQTSIVGVILNNNNEKDGGIYKYVQSNNKLLMQHDTFSWMVNSRCMRRDSIKFIPPLTNSTDLTSKIFERTLRKTLSKMSYKKISIFSEAVFKVFGYEDPDAVMMGQTLKTNFKNSSMFYNLSNLSKEELNVFIEVIGTTLISFTKSIKYKDLKRDSNNVINTFSTIATLAATEGQIKDNLSRENVKTVKSFISYISVQILDAFLNMSL